MEFGGWFRNGSRKLWAVLQKIVPGLSQGDTNEAAGPAIENVADDRGQVGLIVARAARASR